MTYKSIVVSLNATENLEQVLTHACSISEKSGAHLTGIYTSGVPVYPSIGLSMDGEVLMAYKIQQERQAAESQDLFERFVKKRSVLSEWRHLSLEDMSFVSRCADLIILPQDSQNSQFSIERRLQNEVISDSGRPVLVIPSSGNFKTIGKNALVAWDGSKEAARAVHDAIPLFGERGEARILSIFKSGIWSEIQFAEFPEKENIFTASAHELASVLDRHNIAATVASWPKAKLSVGDILLNEASERGCDLIIAGAYSHSRLYDVVIGAATTNLLGQMTVPVLFSH